MKLEIIDKAIEKPPKIEWKAAKKYKDNGYFFKTIQVATYEDDLYIKWSGNRFKPIYGRVRGFKKQTACEIIRERDKMRTDGSERHFIDAIHEFYHSNGMPLGYAAAILVDCTENF